MGTHTNRASGWDAFWQGALVGLIGWALYAIYLAARAAGGEG